jgi:transcriptional regulator with XRE-family HTH domain
MPARDRETDTPTLGDLIRSQRKMQELSVRQFAAMVGISNPYLSQIERNLRAPSDAVVEAIASQFETSADDLYRQVRSSQPEDEEPSEVQRAIEADARLSARQRRALLEVYDAFVSARARGRRR